MENHVLCVRKSCDNGKPDVTVSTTDRTEHLDEQYFARFLCNSATYDDQKT